VSDIEAIDAATEKMLTDMKLLAGNGVEFKARFPDVYFTTVTADGRTVELKKGGASIAVNATNCGSFMSALVQYKLHEFDAAVAALRRGLYSAVPERAIRLLTWKELDAAVGGKPEINVDLLERNTEYEGYDAADPAIKRFWKVMRSFTNEEKSLFIKFVWGRCVVTAGDRWTRCL
jgi:E3 ubiquitin-protein ligase HERC2